MLRTFPLAPALAEAARAWPGDAAVQPRAASTVLLLRDGPAAADVDPEVFVLRRAPTMAFAPRMHVFPGGGVDPRDADPSVPWLGPDPAWWAGELGSGLDKARELVCAAVRELSEECGVLLAGRPGDADVVADLGDPQWEADRQALLDRSLALSELLGRRGLVLRSDLLRPWAHWTTPVFEPRRYDTRFFVAAMPTGQRARDVGGEADHVAWVGARAAVEGHREGRLAMLAPTLVALEEVAAHPAVASVLAAPRRLRRVMPWLTGEELQVDLDGLGGGDAGPGQGGDA